VAWTCEHNDTEARYGARPTEPDVVTGTALPLPVDVQLIMARSPALNAADEAAVAVQLFPLLKVQEAIVAPPFLEKLTVQLPLVTAESTYA